MRKFYNTIGVTLLMVAFLMGLAAAASADEHGKCYASDKLAEVTVELGYTEHVDVLMSSDSDIALIVLGHADGTWLLITLDHTTDIACLIDGGDLSEFSGAEPEGEAL